MTGLVFLVVFTIILLMENIIRRRRSRMILDENGVDIGPGKTRTFMVRAPKPGEGLCIEFTCECGHKHLAIFSEPGSMTKTCENCGMNVELDLALREREKT